MEWNIETKAEENLNPNPKNVMRFEIQLRISRFLLKTRKLYNLVSMFM